MPGESYHIPSSKADRPDLDDLPLFHQRTSWRKLRESGLIDERQQQVLDAIAELEPTTMQDVAAHLHWPINCVTGRFSELSRDPLFAIEVCGKVWNETTRRHRTLYRTAS